MNKKARMFRMEILVALNLISGILGITAKDIVKIQKTVKTPSHNNSESKLTNMLTSDTMINDFILSILIEFMWQQKTDFEIRVPMS
jgi:hypothetical protein